MRRLMLLRHSKAERAQSGTRDRERVLEPRGRADAQRIGAYLAHHGLVPNRVVISPSLRTRQTWELVGAAFASPVPAFDEDRLYDASPDTLLAVIRETPATGSVLLLVGHNPGLHEIARELIASGDVEHREQLNEEFPTSALAVIDFATDEWARVHPHGGRLERFIVPRALAAATD